jgi:hypothetical protein
MFSIGSSFKLEPLICPTYRREEIAVFYYPFGNTISEDLFSYHPKSESKDEVSFFSLVVET